jgi:hypothetical protein
MAKYSLRRAEREPGWAKPYQLRYWRRIVDGAEIKTHFQYETPKAGTKIRAAFDRAMAKRAANLDVRAGRFPLPSFCAMP